MDNTDLELQLKVWKDLAIAKQVLMQAATKALGLKNECTAQELEEALKNTIQAAKIADNKRQQAEEKAKTEVTGLEASIADQAKTIATLTNERDMAQAELSSSEEKREASKTNASDELKKLKAQLADKQKEIKNITKILADTPENVVKKMKALKKDKMDEANLRKAAEEVSRNLRKEKQQVEQKLDEAKATIKQANELVVKHRELDSFANEQYNLLAEKSDDKAALTQVPELTSELLEAIEAANPDASAQKVENEAEDDKQDKKSKKAKKSK